MTTLSRFFQAGNAKPPRSSNGKRIDANEINNEHDAIGKHPNLPITPTSPAVSEIRPSTLGKPKTKFDAGQADPTPCNAKLAKASIKHSGFLPRHFV